MGRFLMTALGVLTCFVSQEAQKIPLSVWAASNAHAVPKSNPYEAMRSLTLNYWANTTGPVTLKMSRLAMKRAATVWKATDRTAVTGWPDNGQLVGTVTKNNTAVAHARVALFYRPTMALLGETYSDAAGGFKFGYSGNPTLALDPGDLINYVALALDPAVTYNAVVLDQLTAVT